MAADWTWWKAAIKAKNEGHDLPPVSADKPEIGFYYSKASRAGGRVPVCIYTDANGDLVARSGTKAEHRVEDAARRWSWVAGSPIDRDSYVYAWEKGTWPDGTPTVAVEAPAAIGDNSSGDPFARLKETLDDKLASAKALLEDITGPQDKVRADRARNIQSELLALKKAADNMHETEKAPHLAACRAVDDKFRFRAVIDDVSKRLRTVFENIAKRLEAEANEAARKLAEEARRKYEEEMQRAAEERQKKLRDDPVAALTDPVPELPAPPPQFEPIKVKVGGGVGRAAGLRDEWTGVVTDWKAVAVHYSDHEKVREAIQKLVAAEVKLHKGSAKIPGVEVTKDRRAA